MAGTRQPEAQESTILDPIRIAFGDIYLYSFDGRSRYLITGVGKGKHFFCTEIQEANSQEFIGILAGSTSDRRDIEKIDGHWDFKQIEHALRMGFGLDNMDPESALKILRRRSKQKPRMLTE